MTTSVQSFVHDVLIKSKKIYKVLQLHYNMLAMCIIMKNIHLHPKNFQKLSVKIMINYVMLVNVTIQMTWDKLHNK